jgi:hypothetical protein
MNNESALSRLCFHGKRLETEAKVSQATVRYVLNNDPHQTIPEETRVKVLEAGTNWAINPSSICAVCARMWCGRYAVNEVGHSHGS